jgi:hypothetical protein
MGITVKTFSSSDSIDRNVARLEIFCDSDDRDAWQIVAHFQDATYEGDTRVEAPRFGTARVSATFGQLKDMALPGGGGGKVSDLLAPIRALCYALLQQQQSQPAPTPPAPPPTP